MATDREDRFHVAVIMDGNGRWAQRRGRLRAIGHVAGTAAVRRIVEAAPGLGITTLTLYAFSSDNWRRPPGEVGHLMRLFGKHLDAECARMVERGVRLNVIGRRDRIPTSLVRKIADVEERTRAGATLHLRIAVDYSARDALIAAAETLRPNEAREAGPRRPGPRGDGPCGHRSPGDGPPRTGPASRAAFAEALSRAIHAPAGTRDVDLLVRTGGEQRLSDFLLWESAYAELVFTDVLWPDFSADDLAAAVRTFGTRNRRFGGLPEPEPALQNSLHTLPLRRRRAVP